MDAMLLVKVTIVLALTLGVSHLVRRAAAVTRHRLWTVAFVSLVALPWLAFALPTLYLPVPEGWSTNAVEEARAARADISSQPENGALGDVQPARNPEKSGRESFSHPLFSDVRAGSILLMGWLAGTTAALATLLVSLVRARRLAGIAQELDDHAWRHAAMRIAARLGMRRAPRLLVSRHVGSPMAGGVWSPVVFLPATIETWNAERRDVVLAHEMAHLAGGDPLRHVLARVAVALYWFHPFVWIAAWQSSVAREQACDEAVLALGTTPSAYARVLLDLAESMDPPVSGVAALPMVERSLLETRLMTILTNDTRAVEKRRILIPAIAVAALTLPLAAAQPAQTSQAPNVAQAAEVPAAAVPAVAPAARMAANAAQAPAAQTASLPEAVCSWSGSGNSSMRTSGTERLIQQTFGAVQLCMVAMDAGDRTDERPSQWMGRARRVIIEARQANAVQRLEIVRTGAAEQVSWRVGTAQRPFDAAAQQWRDRVLALFDTAWELAALRGEVSSLRGQISSVHGQSSSLRGEISSLRGEVSALRGRASSVRGEESALRGRISAIHGHVSALRGAISAERGAISAVHGSRYGADASERAQIETRLKRHEGEVARIEQTIRDYNAEAKIAEVQKEIDALRADTRTGAIEAEIAAFDLPGKIAVIERRIAELNVEGRVGALERQIGALDVDRRSAQLQERRDAELRQLEAAIAAIR